MTGCTLAEVTELAVLPLR